jgi:succinoglycan biosynthesis transport protein ExoP
MAQSVSHGRDDDRSEGGEIDVRALGRGVWRRKLWIVVPTVLAALAALVFVQLSSPMYRSGALVLIENREGAAPRSGAERDQALPDEQAVASQVQLIQSRDLVRRVVKSLDLANDPEFGERKPGLLSRLLGAVGLGGQAQTQPFNERVVDRVARNLSVYPVSGSRVVGVEFVSTNADSAARVVNGFVDAYLDIQRDAKRETNRQASQYLADEIASLRGRVGDAEERVEAFRAKAGLLVGTNNTTVAAQQLGDTSNQLSTSRTQQAESQAKADMIRSVLRQGRPAEALDIANSELVRQLSQRRSELAAQIASESRTLLPQHPRMRELTAQLAGLDQQVRSEAEKLARAFENEAKTAGARVAALSKQLDGLKSTAATANGQEVQLRALEREARSQRDLMEQLLTRYREASARENPEALLADARVISRGAAATEPYFPKKGPTIALAALGAFMLALFSVAAAEIFGGQRRPADAPPPLALGGDTPAFGRLRGPMTPAAPQPGPASAAAAPNAPAKASIAPPAARAIADDRPGDPREGGRPSSGNVAALMAAAAAAPTTGTPSRTGPTIPAASPSASAPEMAVPTPPASPPPSVATEVASAAAAAAAAPASAQPAAAPPSPAQPAPSPVSSQSAPKSPLDRPPARQNTIECADATLVSALARQLAAMPTGDGALRILTTGAVPDLGVATVAAKLAATISESGRRVVAVDAAGGTRNGEEGPGLAELLSGEATFAQAIHRDRGSRVHLVPQGAEPFDRLDPAARSRLGLVLEALALTYDFVMITTPSGPGGAEPFAAHCSAAVLVSNAGAADAVTVEAHQRLKATGIDDVVVVLITDGGGTPGGRSLAA